MIKLLVFLIRLVMLIVVANLMGWLCIVLALVLWDGWYVEILSKIYDGVKPWGGKQ